LPATPATGLTFVIKDCKGDANTNNITITPGCRQHRQCWYAGAEYALVFRTMSYNGTQWVTY